MKTVTVEYEVYTYEELSEQAKEKVKKWYLEGQDPEIFSDICKSNLQYLFPESELDVQFSLSYCQGDGLNIYGTLYLDEVLVHLKEHFTDKEQRFFTWLFNYFGAAYSLEENRHYCYCLCSRQSYFNEYIDQMEYNDFRNIPYDLFEKAETLYKNYLCKICSQFEDDGYEYFYEVDDETLSDHCYANDYIFLADGTIF